MCKIILASSSIYRQELLKRLPIKFSSTSPNINEARINDENFGDLARRLSNEKAEVISKTNRYSSLGVDKLVRKGYRSSYLKAFLHGIWSFLKHYIFKLGFLYGGPGFVIALGNFEGTYYRYIKLLESQENWKSPKVNALHKK